MGEMAGVSGGGGKQDVDAMFELQISNIRCDHVVLEFQWT